MKGNISGHEKRKHRRPDRRRDYSRKGAADIHVSTEVVEGSQSEGYLWSVKEMCGGEGVRWSGEEWTRQGSKPKGGQYRRRLSRAGR